MKETSQLVYDIAKLKDDPYKFVKYVFPWGEKGTSLEHYQGPSDWQKKALNDLSLEIKKRAFDGHKAVDPIRIAVASGHGIGKTAFVAMIIIFIMSTRPDAKGVVTSNTLPQLETKTWAELSKWHKLAINKDWFDIRVNRGNLRFFAKDNPEGWFFSGQTCKEENSEAFAGLHNINSSSVFIFDEASAIPNKIWEVAEGGLTDGEPFIFVFGNPTKNSGKFFECFNANKHRWKTKQIDSRVVDITNKVLIQQWIDDWGEDSDFVRVRVKGEFPRIGSSQFFSSQVLLNCRKHTLEDHELKEQVRTLACDVARFGEDQTVITERHGSRFRILQKYQGIDTMQTAARLADYMSSGDYDACFIDDCGIGGGVTDRLNQLGYSPVAVNAGSRAMDSDKYANKRAEMFGLLRDYIKNIVDLEDDKELIRELEQVEYGFTNKQQILLVSKKIMKKMGFSSPDTADSVALHFAEPVIREQTGNFQFDTDF